MTVKWKTPTFTYLKKTNSTKTRIIKVMCSFFFLNFPYRSHKHPTCKFPFVWYNKEKIIKSCEWHTEFYSGLWKVIKKSSFTANNQRNQTNKQTNNGQKRPKRNSKNIKKVFFFLTTSNRGNEKQKKKLKKETRRKY